MLLLGGILLALDTIISQAFGAGLLEECRGAMVQGVYIALALTPVITAATFAITGSGGGFGGHSGGGFGGSVVGPMLPAETPSTSCRLV